MVNKLYTKKDQHRLFKRSVSDKLIPDVRTPFQKDRDRVIHSEPFRRLQNKTQVLLPGDNDFYRTRLTHSIEVAQIGRSIAYFLNQNADGLYRNKLAIDYDLVEAICISHDIGHSPFGHLGERALNVVMNGPKERVFSFEKGNESFIDDVGKEVIGDCGFEGNAQNLRILENLGNQLGDMKGQDGFNPTRAMWEGMLKYLVTADYVHEHKLFPKFIYDSTLRSYTKEKQSFFNLPKDEYIQYNYRCIENQIMEFADDISYSVLDLEDAFNAEFISAMNMDQIVEFIEGFQAQHGIEFHLPGKKNLISFFRSAFKTKSGVRKFKNYFIALFISNLELSPCESRFKSTRFNLKLHFRDESYGILIELFKQITKEFVYMTPHILQLRYSFPMYIIQMFKAFYYDTRLLPKHVQLSLPSHLTKSRLKKINDLKLEVWSKPRIICDYIASMTDHYFLKKYKKMFQGGEIPYSHFE